MSTFEILDSSHEILPEPKRGSGNNAPVQQAERIAWALTRVLEAIDRMAKAPHEPALVLAVVARRREYQTRSKRRRRLRVWRRSGRRRRISGGGMADTSTLRNVKGGRRLGALMLLSIGAEHVVRPLPRGAIASAMDQPHGMGPFCFLGAA